jgi:hypothetical protein
LRKPLIGALTIGVLLTLAAARGIDVRGTVAAEMDGQGRSAAFRPATADCAAESTGGQARTPGQH